MKRITRRTAVGAIGASFATGALAQDRPQARTAGAFGGRNIWCENDGVAVSDVASRLSRPDDFSALAGCRLTEDSFEGPYFMCAPQQGKNITGGRKGHPLAVSILVQDESCTPVSGAYVDIWACDAEGNYSGYTASPDQPATTGNHVKPQTDERFCRGVLATDADGIAEFDTLYPGYYSGRAIHIHFKIHLGNRAYITSQALLPEAANDVVLKLPPYNEPRGTKRVTNRDEGVSESDSSSLFHVVERRNMMLAVYKITLAG